MMHRPLSFISLVAYDYEYLADSIKSYYEIADEIILGLDENKKTWSGNDFEIDFGKLEATLRKIDYAGKIKLVQSDFYKFDKPIYNDTYERNYLSLHCKENNWIISIDADERLMNPIEFNDWMSKLDMNRQPESCNILATWWNVFKVIDGKKLYINSVSSIAPIGTYLRNSYRYARWANFDNTSYRGPEILSPLNLEHFCYGRTEQQVWQKLCNWGHAKDFDVEKFYNLWKSITLENYHTFKNFHPANGAEWPELVILD